LEGAHAVTGAQNSAVTGAQNSVQPPLSPQRKFLPSKLKYEALEINEIGDRLKEKCLYITVTLGRLKVRHLYITTAVGGPFESKVAYVYITVAIVGFFQSVRFTHYSCHCGPFERTVGRPCKAEYLHITAVVGGP